MTELLSYLCKKHSRPAVVELNNELYCWKCYPGLRDAIRKDKLAGLSGK